MKYLPLFFLFLSFNVLLSAQTAIPPSSGDGTTTSPYEIAALENLYWLSANDDIVPDPDRVTRWSSHYVQVADIDATETLTWFDDQGWEPIGFYFNADNTISFSGSYNGQNNTIDALYINRPTRNNIGLFGRIEGAQVSNLGVTNLNVTGQNSVGGLTGQSRSNSMIDNCYSSGNVSGYSHIGCLVGYNTSSSTISNSHSLGTVFSTGNNTGGLLGTNSSATVIDCHSNAGVSGYSYVGGLVGWNNTSALIDNSYSVGDVNAEGPAGGLAGVNQYSSIIQNSYSTGGVISYGCASCGSVNSGGLLGMNQLNSIVRNCYSTGTANGNDNVGGLVGENIGNSLVDSSYSTGSVVGTGFYVGGLVGNNQTSQITNSYAAGSATGFWRVGGLTGGSAGPGSAISYCYSTTLITANYDPGGLVAYVSGGSVTGSYWDMEFSNQLISAGGEGRTTAQMTYPYYADSFVDWDWNETWIEDPSYANNGYPYLSWQNFEYLLYPPANLSAIPCQGSVILNWSVPISEELPVLGYNIYRDEVIINLEPLIELTFEDFDVINDETYEYFVTALYSEGESVASNIIEATPYTYAPPGNLTATPFHGLVLLEWESPEEQEFSLLGYNVYRDNQMINTATVIDTLFSDQSVTNDVTYEYFVTALYEESESGGSNIAVATPYSLNPPQNLAAISHQLSIELAWEEPLFQDLEVAGYNIYRNDTIINPLPLEDLTFTDDDIENDVYYSYYVTAIYQEGESSASNLIEAISYSLTPPHSLIVIVNNNAVLLNWEAPSNPNLDILGYNVYRNEFVQNDSLITLTEYEDIEIEYGVTYEYYVTALYTSGESDPSNFFSVTPYLTPAAQSPSAGDGSPEDPYVISSLANLYWITASNDIVPQPDQTIRWASHYIQTADIDAEETTVWFEGQGWLPIGENFDIFFSGSYDGQDYSIDALYCNRPLSEYIGLFGSIRYAEIKNVKLTDIDLTGGTYAGGLIGRNRYSHVSNCYTTGYLLGNTHVGGLIGRHCSSSTVSSCYSSVIVNGVSLVGGLSGENTGAAIISDSYATGTATGTHNVGGLVGNSTNATITNCYSTGYVSGESIVGGLLGYNDLSIINNSYWDIGTSGQIESAGGEGRSTEDMTYPYGIDAYNTWDFIDIWSIDPLYRNNGYPFLQWQGYITVLNPPQNLIATTYHLYVELNWDVSMEQGLAISGYNVYRDSLMINEETVVDTTFIDENVVYDVPYEYYVTVLYEEGESEPSNTIIITCSMPSPPTVDFSADHMYGVEPLTVVFTNETETGEGEIVSWEWDFGDENGSTEQNPLHTYLTAGIYSVSLTVTDEFGFSYSEIKEDYITVVTGEPFISLLSEETIDFGTVYVANQSEYQTIGISNIGNSTLIIDSIHFQDVPTHFTFSLPEARTISLEPEEVLNIEVCFTPQTVGTILDTLYIVNNSNNDPILTVELSGIGEYVPPMPPDNITTTIINYDAVISWDPVTTNIYGQPLEPDFYFVFYNGSEDVEGEYYYHGYTFGTEYIHELVAMAANHMFYYVIAVKLYEQPARERDSLTRLLQSRLQKGMSADEVSYILDELIKVR